MIGKWYIRARCWIAIGLLAGCEPAAEDSLGERQERYRRAVSENPSDPEAHYQLGRVYYEQTRYAQALQAFRRARTLNSAHVGAQIGIGKVLLVRGELTGAQEAYSDAAMLCDDCGVSHRGLGAVYLRQ